MKLKIVFLRLIPAILPLQMLAGCGDGGGPVPAKFGGDTDTVQACFSGSGKAEVLEIMRDWYLWNDEADQFNKYRNLNLGHFGDANGLLEFLRYRPAEFDRGFSYITTPEEEQAFFGEGEFVGFGFSLARVGNEIYFTQVFEGSPADAVGFQRGYRLLEINGRSIALIEASEGLAEALGPPQVGFNLEFTVANAAGVVLPREQVSKARLTIDPVPFVTTTLQDGGGNDAGYILFNTFITSAGNELRMAFAQFETVDISRVVIDLRYNGGGLVSVSELLASLLAGPGHVGDVYTMHRFNNARAAEFDTSVAFSSEPDALTLEKIVFITSSGTASASELVINGLEPYFSNLDLGLVGSRTFGKPVGQFAFDFCDERFRLRAVTFKSVNADGEGDYFDGLPVDCPAGDDVFNPLGNPNEASLAAALEYMGSGTCPVSAAPGLGISHVEPSVRPVTGPGIAQQYAGAF